MRRLLRLRLFRLLRVVRVLAVEMGQHMLARKVMIVSVAGVFHYLRRECLAIFTGKNFAARRAGVAVGHYRLQTLDFG